MRRKCPEQMALAITHLHTDASNAEASELDGSIGGAIRRIHGQDTPVRWAECFTRIDQVMGLLDRGGRGPVHLVIVTDHMRRRSHAHPPGHLLAAASDHRLALGAELATRTLDLDGQWRPGPEILAYGSPHLVEGPYGPYYGLPRELLDELYETCLDDEGLELCTRRAHKLLRRRGIAHALSHPFDGHDLSLAGTFAIISEFCFIEVINGGYFRKSTQILKDFLTLANALQADMDLDVPDLGATGQAIVGHLRAHGRRLHPWAGSDAHVRDLDRVVVGLPLPPGSSPSEMRPGDLFDWMLRVEGHGEGGHGDPPGEALLLGEPGTPLSQVGDIVAIIVQNFLRNGRWLFNPLLFPRVLYTTYVVTRGELVHRGRRQRGRERTVKDEFDPAALLAHLVARPLRTAPDAPQLSGAEAAPCPGSGNHDESEMLLSHRMRVSI